MDDLYKLEAITDSRLVKPKCPKVVSRARPSNLFWRGGRARLVQRLQVLTQMPVINAEHFHLNETSFNGADCRHSTSKLSPSQSSNRSLGQNIQCMCYH